MSSRIRQRLFLHLGLNFTSDREDFLVEMFILAWYFSGDTEEEQKWEKKK